MELPQVETGEYYRSFCEILLFSCIAYSQTTLCTGTIMDINRLHRDCTKHSQWETILMGMVHQDREGSVCLVTTSCMGMTWQIQWVICAKASRQCYPTWMCALHQTKVSVKIVWEIEKMFKDNELQGQHPQGVNYFDGTANGYFGAIGSNNTSTSSLPSMPSGHPRASATNNYHFRPFSMDASQHLQQHQQQQRGFTHPGMQQSGRQPNQYQNMGSGQQMNNFGNANANGPFHSNQQSYTQQTPLSPYSTVNSHHHNNINSGSSPFGNSLSPLQQQHQQQSAQNHHYFGIGQQHNNYGGHPQQQQQMGTSNGGQFQMQAADQSGGWLSVPPGFTPRTGQHWEVAQMYVKKASQSKTS